MAEAKGDLVLPVGIDELLFHLHLGTMPQDAFNHCRHLRRRTGFELGVDARRMLFDVPVDHNSFATIAHVPFGHQILVPGTELCGVRGTGGCSFSPDMRLTHLKNRVGDIDNRRSEMLLVDEPTASVDQLIVALSVIPLTDPLETRIGSYSVEAQQETYMQDLSIQNFTGSRAFEVLHETDTQSRFFEDI